MATDSFATEKSFKEIKAKWKNVCVAKRFFPVSYIMDANVWPRLDFFAVFTGDNR